MPDVAIVKCNNYSERDVAESVRRALDLIGGAHRIIKPRQRVMLKINLLSAKKPEDAVTTHPSIVKAVIDIVKDAGATPLIGESSGGVGMTEKAFRISGIKEIAELTDTEIINFEFSETYNLRSETLDKMLPAAKPLLDADIVISLPKLKTHTFMLYTGAVKNFFGALPGEWKSLAHKLAEGPAKFANLLLDIYLAANPKLAIMDGVLAMNGNGPSAGNPRWTNLIIASQDCLALDFVACKLIGYNPFGVYVIREAINRKLLEYDKIEIVGENLDLVKVGFEKPVSELSRNVFPQVNRNKCKKCSSCIKYCPVNAIRKDENDFPVFDRERCIQCYCCHELCQYGAIMLSN